MAVKLSDELTAWARRAGYSVLEHQGTGTLELWTNPGGELRFYVQQPGGGDHRWTLASSDRGAAERVELSAHAASVLERYLLALLGDVIRERMLLPAINIPSQPHSLPATCSVSEPDSNGYRVLTQRSAALARARGRITGMSTLVKVAHLLNDTVGDIEASYLSKDGRPMASSWVRLGGMVNRAVIVGLADSAVPKVDRSRIVHEFGEDFGPRLADEVEGIVRDAAATHVDWGSMTLREGVEEILRSVHESHPELSPEALHQIGRCVGWQMR